MPVINPTYLLAGSIPVHIAIALINQLAAYHNLAPNGNYSLSARYFAYINQLTGHRYLKTDGESCCTKRNISPSPVKYPIRHEFNKCIR